MTPGRLLQPDGVPVYIPAHYVLAIWLCPIESIDAGGVSQSSVVAWWMPSDRPDRVSSGRLNIVRGNPDEVARALGLVSAPREGT